MGGICTLCLIVYLLLATLHCLESAGDQLNFLLLGDWGKGGNSGYMATHISDTVNDSGADDDKSPVKQKRMYEEGDIKHSPQIADESIDRKLQNNKVTYQASVAKAMGTYSNDFQPSFVVALGDNFYTNGVSSSTDVYWDYLWTNVYLDYYASLRIPWYPVFGNHDYGYGAKGIQAQLDRTLIDDYWSMKSTNYSKTFNIPNGGSVIIVFVDTTTLAPSVNKCCNENGGISTAVQAIRIQNQLDNIDAMLEEANQRNPTWLLVAGHYPIFSMGEHGDTSELQTYLLPRLNKFNVHAYFCGHDHFSEHLKYGDVQYFVAGGGAMTDYIGATSAATGIWAGEGYSAFASATATKEELSISFIDTDGKTKYTKVLNNPRSGESPTYYPTEAPPRPKTVDVTSKIVIISSGFAALAFLLIAGGFYYESKGKKKKKKPKKWSKGFMSYALPTAGFSKTFKKSSKPKNSLRALASTRTPRNIEEAMDLVSHKKEFPQVENNEEEGTTRNIVLGTNTSGEPATSFMSSNTKHNKKSNNSDANYNSNDDNTSKGRRRASNVAPIWDEETATAKALNLPHTIITHLTSSTPIGVQRSKDGRIFEAIPDVSNEHHKRARTSIF